MANGFGGQGVGTNYRGTNAQQPPNMTFNSRSPNQYDTKNVSLGDFWMNTDTEEVFILVSLQGTSSSIGMLADWVLFTGGAGTVVSLTSNSGGAVGPDGSGNINVVGDGTTITGVGNPGSNTITLSAGASLATHYAADSGTAIPSAGILNIDGSSNIRTAASGNTVSVILKDAVTITGAFAAASVTTTSGNIVSAANISTAGGDIVTGTGDITTGTGSVSAGSNIITTGGNISAPSGTITAGTGLSVLSFGAGVVRSDALGDLSSSNGTNGQILIGGGTAPIWANITGGSGITVTNAANSITISQGVSTSIPCFQAQITAPQAAVTGDNTVYQVIFGGTNFDQGGNFNTATGVFTAPTTGKYLLSSFILLQGLDVAHTDYVYILVTSARSYYYGFGNVGAMQTGSHNLSISFPATVVDMTASDTAYFTIQVAGGAKTVGVAGGGGTTNGFFTGYLIQ